MSSSLVRRRLDRQLLNQLLDEPDLAPALRALPAPALQQLILRVGLEDAGELVALASLEQLRDVFDEDLWRSERPGEDEEFDAERFTVWLEILLEGGDRFAADRLAELSEEFLVFAVSQLVRVLDLAVLTTWAGDPDAAHQLDQILDSQLSQELDDFLLLSRQEHGWDAVLTLLLTLDERHPTLLRAVLGQCAGATHDEIRSTRQLRSVLSGERLLLEDARAEREDRRAERGYVSPSDARAFLGLARTPPTGPEIDPISRAHFRGLESMPDSRDAGAAAAQPPASAPLRELLLEAGAEPGMPPAKPRVSPGFFRQTLDELLDLDPPAHQRVLEELAFLSNVVVSGDATAEGPWQPVEAAERVLELCEDGLRAIVSRSDNALPRELLARWGATGAFRVAWAARDGDG